jgi:hypothetical protein
MEEGKVEEQGRVKVSLMAIPDRKIMKNEL